MPMRPPTFKPPRLGALRLSARAQSDVDRGSAAVRGYGARWTEASLQFRKQNPLCLGCEAVGMTEPSTLTDHVIPHKGDMTIFWNSAMWQPACDWHHDCVKKLLELRFAKGTLDAAALWLNSPAAMALTRSMGPS
jgi:5-methylcytosine-specific restriction protein A